MTHKPFWQSKTLWLNAIMVALAGINQFGGLVTDPRALGYIAIATAVLNSALRLFSTAKPISLNGGFVPVTKDGPGQ